MFFIITLIFILTILTPFISDIQFNNNLVKIPRDKPSDNGGVDQVLYDLIEGRDYDSTQIEQVCAYLDGRYDCTDFKTPSILHILYSYKDQLHEGDFEKLKRALLDYKYWMTDPGEDSMCMWSENHLILFAAAEYLAGSLFPDDIFTNTGWKGREHAERGRQRVLIWLEQRWDYGFIEWYSNTYYKEDIGPLAVLIDLAPHGEVSLKASIIMDLLLYDMASQSYTGSFVSTMGRGYETKKMSGKHSSVKGEMEFFFGFDVVEGESWPAGMGLNLIFSQVYKLPPVLKEIAHDEGTGVIKASLGLDLTELKEKGLIGQDDEQIMMQWAMESFSNPLTIKNSLTYIENNTMFANSDFYDFKDVNFTILKSLGLLPLISKILNPQTNGVAIQRANTYTYRTPYYTLYTTQNYQSGDFGDQQHVMGMTLAEDLSIFHSHPAVETGESGANGNSPTYWVGYGRLPHSVQFENVNLSLYRIPHKKGLLEKDLLDYTHAYFPSEKFDESSLEGPIAFGRKGETFVAFIASGNLSYRYYEEKHSTGGREYDLVLPGKEVFWITEASSKLAEGSYDDFRRRIKDQARRISYDGNTLTYLGRDKIMTLTFGGDFTVNGERQNLQYGRFDSPYVKSEREPDRIEFQWNGRSLLLDFDNQIRDFD